MKDLQQYSIFVCGNHDKANTRRGYIQNVNRFLQYIDKPIKDITQNDLDQFASHCYLHRKQNTNAVSFWCINKFLKWDGRLDIKLPKITQIDANKTALDEENTEKLFDTVENLSPLHRLVFYLEYDAIRRPEEIRKIKTTDRYGDILKYDGKRKTIPNRVVITERLKRAWDDYLKVRPTPSTFDDEDYLLLSDYGQFCGKRMETYARISRIIKEICMYAQIDIPHNERPTNYLIKRTSISRQLKECPDPKIIQLQAGHSKLETTMKYNRITDDDIRKYLKTFDDKRKLINGKSKIFADKKHLVEDKIPQTFYKNIENEDNANYSFSIFSFSEFDFFKPILVSIPQPIVRRWDR